MTAPERPQIEDAVRVLVEAMARAELGGAAHVDSVSSEASRFATASPAEVVTAALRDGRELRLFVKRSAADSDGNPDKLDRGRESLVYRHLLDGRSLPVPRFLGSYGDLCSGRGEIFLEYVDDWSLQYHRLEHWVTAAEQLARLHAYFLSRQAELARAHFLLRLDGRYFGAWADRALAAVSSRSDRLRRLLARSLQDREEAIRLLVEQPPTLVHNDLAPKNVIADTSTIPARIRFVDWEMAGVGCGLLDLVHLAHGFGEAERQSLLESYRGGLGPVELLPEGNALRRLIAACSVHNSLYRLAHLEAWELGDDIAEAWVDEVSRFQSEI